MGSYSRNKLSGLHPDHVLVVPEPAHRDKDPSSHVAKHNLA